MRGHGCWDDYTERKPSRESEREEKNEGTSDVEGDRVIKDGDRRNRWIDGWGG